MKISGTAGLRWPQLNLLAVFLMVSLLSSTSWAQVDYYWAAQSGDWGTATNWNPNGVPGATDNAYLHQSDANNRTVSYRNIYPVAPTLGSVIINASGTGTMTLELATAGLAGTLVSNLVTVGNMNQGVLNQSDGILDADPGYLILGNQAGGTGTYNLTGGALTAANTFVGNDGTGTFTQNGGTHTVANELNVGLNAGSTGTYNLQNGTIDSNYMFVGYNGTGTFNQTGGAVNITGGGHLGVGREAGSTGVYNLQGGTFDTTGELYVGWSGTGTFNQTGGAVTATGDINMAEQNTGRATYNLQVGNLAANGLFVGMWGIGTFNQSAGTTLNLNTLYLDSQAGTSVFNQAGGATAVAGHLGVGREPGSHGEYNLENGTLTAGNLFVGYEGTGTFNQTGGACTVNEYIHMGTWNAAAVGTYNLQGGTLAAVNLYLGGLGSGAFNQSGASTFTIDELHVNNGTYALAGGTLNATTINLNPGCIFSQTGGTLNFTTFNHQGGEVQGSLQNPAGGTYIYDNGTFTGRLLNSGTAIFNADFTAGNGMAHYSILTLDPGRSLTFNGQGLTVDQGGAFTQNGGTLTAASETIGNTGIGTFTQAGGTHNVTNILTLAANPGSTGTFNLQGGALSAGTINLNAGGTFNRTGGTLNYTTLSLQGGEFVGDLVNQGLLRGTGPITGNVVNQGNVNPGLSPGILNIVGSYHPGRGRHLHAGDRLRHQL
jgi:hypothetical protein